jgi:ElaB/YqjD/DUF883 family membrane-anchored ribosome-binding protein
MDAPHLPTSLTRDPLVDQERLPELEDRSVKPAKAKFQRAADTARQALDEFAGASKEVLDDTALTLKESLEAGREKAQDVYGRAKIEAADRFTTLEETVRQKPGIALATAAGLGLLIGLLLRGRSKVIYPPR